MARRTRMSRLLRDILLVNLLPVALIFVALFYLDQYQQGLLANEVAALREQARIYAGALAQSAVQNQSNQPVLDQDLAQPLLYQLIEPTPNAQALIYGPDGQVIANSRVHPGPGGAIITEPLPPVQSTGFLSRLVGFVYDHLSGSVAGRPMIPAWSAPAPAKTPTPSAGSRTRARPCSSPAPRRTRKPPPSSAAAPTASCSSPWPSRLPAASKMSAPCC